MTRPIFEARNCANRPVPSGRSPFTDTSGFTHAPMRQASVVAHAGLQSLVVAVHADCARSPLGMLLTIAAWMHACPAAHRPAQAMRVESIVVMVQLDSPLGSAPFAVASRS